MTDADVERLEALATKAKGYETISLSLAREAPEAVLALIAALREEQRRFEAAEDGWSIALNRAEAAEARLEAMKAVIVKRMHEVDPCFVHTVPDTTCATCKHDLFMAALVDEATKKRGER